MLGDYPEFVRQLNAGDTEQIRSRVNDNINLLHALIGINTENGELQDQFKRFVFYGKELDFTNIKEELGDLLWYIQLACNQCNCTIEDLIRMNINKLKARYQGTWTSEKALNRNLVVERVELEK